MANEPKTNEAVIVQSGSIQTASDPENQWVVNIANPEDKYPMNNTSKGIAIIINQKTFFHQGTKEINDKKERLGTDKDRDDIRATLKRLQFEVKDDYVLNDLTFDELFEKLKKIGESVPGSHDCLAVVVMTHGDTGVLCAKDGDYKIDDLWKKFTEDPFRAKFHGKPKLFFIQACRGEGEDRGEQYFADAKVLNSNSSDYNYFPVPSETDFLVMYASYEDYYSFRHPETGSLFIQSLCELLNRHGQSHELLGILTAVSEDVANMTVLYVKNKVQQTAKQMPTIISTLTKTVYFGPNQKERDEERK